VKQVIIFVSAILCLAVFGSQPLVAAPAVQQDSNRCLISSPASGSQLRGQVVIAGTATHVDFKWYQIGYAPDPNPTGKWTFFASSETAVTSGRLGVWDTAQFPDGTYQLILEVHRKDTNNDHCFMQKLYVNNTAPTATFTAQPLPTAAKTSATHANLLAHRQLHTYAGHNRVQAAHRHRQHSQCFLPRSGADHWRCRDRGSVLCHPLDHGQRGTQNGQVSGHRRVSHSPAAAELILPRVLGISRSGAATSAAARGPWG
jgi:hypothetical protein